MKAMIGAGGLVLALALSAASPASADMSGTVGNTIVINYPDGSVTKVWTQADGTFSISRNGGMFHGTWADDGKQVCYTESDPAVAKVCTPSPTRKVGDTWNVSDVEGKPVTAKLVAGHQ